MIANVTKGKSFAALARYLEAGRDSGDNPHRVAWTEARNLLTNDPQSTSHLIETTAAQSVRTQKPVYRIALSFDPDDTVDRATML